MKPMGWQKGKKREREIQRETEGSVNVKAKVRSEKLVNEVCCFGRELSSYKSASSSRGRLPLGRLKD